MNDDYLSERNALYKNVVDFLVEETSASESEAQKVLSYEDILVRCTYFKVTLPQLLNLFGRGRKYEREFLASLSKSHTEVCQFCGDSGRSYPTLENPDGVVCDCMLNRNDP